LHRPSFSYVLLSQNPKTAVEVCTMFFFLKLVSALRHEFKL